MSQHTPGPWKMERYYREITVEARQVPIIVFKRHVRECRCEASDDGTGLVLDPLCADIEASARLIAKAPEMHHELTRLTDEMQAASSGGDPVNADWLDRRIQRVRALLREIEGEPQG